MNALSEGLTRLVEEHRREVRDATISNIISRINDELSVRPEGDPFRVGLIRARQLAVNAATEVEVTRRG